jgi:hypothetical protein
VKNKFHGQFVPPLDTLNLQYKGDQAPSFRMRVTNRSAGPLYFALLACNGDWGIVTNFLAQECTTLETTEEFFARDGNPVTMTLKPGATETHDHIVLVISPDWFDASGFGLPNLTGATSRDFADTPPPAPPPTGDFATRHLEIVTRR